MSADSLRFLDQDGVQMPTPFDVDCVLDKERSVRQYVNYMLDRTNLMFEYEGLPNTIPAYVLEQYLQIFGYAAFVRIDEGQSVEVPQKIKTPPGVYIFFGGIGGMRDIYFRPKLFIAANPRLKNSVQSTILYDESEIDGVENPCVIMKNDLNYMGLLPLYNRYASQMTENDISVRSAQINARALAAVEASTDGEAEQARKFFDDLEAGKLGIIGKSAFLDGIRTSNISTQAPNTVIQLIELQQYLKASWYNELGLNVNFNMKREYMSEEEIAVNTDILLPLVDDMLKCRQEACELINKTFGLNISVKKSSAWANKEQEELAALAEASEQGGIGLKETIAEKIEGGVAIGEAEEQSVPTEVPEGETPAEVEPASSGEEADKGNEPAREADVTVDVNVTVKEVDEDGVQSNEPEAQEKSEEPPAE